MWVREGNNFDNLFFQCLRQYITFEVMEGAYDISCPDPHCPTQVSNSLHSLGNSKITFNSGSLEPDPDGNFNRQTLDGKTPNFPLKHRQEFTWIKSQCSAFSCDCTLTGETDFFFNINRKYEM